jgi:hypothetical protein
VLQETTARAQRAGVDVSDADENAISSLGQSTPARVGVRDSCVSHDLAQGLALFAGGYLLTTIATANLVRPDVPAGRLCVLVAVLGPHQLAQPVVDQVGAATPW